MLPTGTRLGDYIVARHLSSGGMGTIYQAMSADMSGSVAIKVMLAGFQDDEHYRQRFAREIEIMQSLHHPNIVEIYAYGEEQGLLYFVMQLVRGSSLLEEINRRRFSPVDVQNLLEPLAQALDYAHQQAVIHRDIKPGNVLLEARPNQAKHIYLTDFGLSKLVSALSLTQPGMTLGTPEYMAPEQVMDQPITPQTDIYSLGILMYQLLIGRLPFASKAPEEVALMQVEALPPAPTSLRPDFPPALEDVLMTALSKNPQDRFPTAGDLYAAYTDAIQSLDPELANRDYWDG